MKRGRKSAASLATVSAVQAVARPDAPYDLTDEQAAEWWAVVNRLDASWFPRETHALLSQYCRHVVRARRVAQLLNKIEADSEFDPREYTDLLRTEGELSRIIASLATKMRISHQSTVRAESARKPSQSGKPWEA